MLSASWIESVFHPILEKIQEHRYKILAESIPSGLEAKENYQWNWYLHRGAENQALYNRLDNSAIKKFHRWSELEGSKVSQPGFTMLEKHTAGANTRYLQLIFVKVLWPVRTSDRYGSRGIRVIWHNTDKGEVYEGVDQTLEVENYMPLSFCINRGKGDISRRWRWPELRISQNHLVINVIKWQWNHIRV